jgi:hypothetical protein
METPGGGILGRLTERVLGYVALGLVALGGIAVYRMGPEGRTAIWETIWRTATWLAISAVLPWTARLFMGRLLEIGSNWVGVALIAGLTLLNLVAGVCLLTAWPAGGWQWTAALVALALAATYNYLVTEYLADQAGA